MRRRATFLFLLTLCGSANAAWLFNKGKSDPPPPALTGADADCLALLVRKAEATVAADKASWDADTEASAGTIVQAVMRELATDATAAGQERVLHLLWKLLGEQGAFANPQHMADVTEWLEQVRRDANEILQSNRSVQDGNALTIRKPSKVQPLLDWVGSVGGAVGRYFTRPAPGALTGASLAAAEVGVDTQIERTRTLRERLAQERRQWRDNAATMRRVSRLFGAVGRRASAARDQLPAGSAEQLFFLALARSVGEAQQMYLLTAVYIQEGAERCLDAEQALTDSNTILLGRTRPNLMRLRAGQTVMTALDVADVNHMVDWAVARAADEQDLAIAQRLQALNRLAMEKMSGAPYDETFRDLTLRILAETEVSRAAWDADEERRREALVADTEAYYQRSAGRLAQRELTIGGANAPAQIDTATSTGTSGPPPSLPSSGS